MPQYDERRFDVAGFDEPPDPEADTPKQTLFRRTTRGNGKMFRENPQDNADLLRGTVEQQDTKRRLLS